MELILISLAAMKATEFIRELIPFPLDAWLKCLVAGGFAALGGFLTGQRPLVVAGAWGLSGVLHELQAVLSMISDNYKQEIMLRAATRGRNIR